MLIVMGDFNSKVGKEAYQKQMARMHTIHESSNENRRILGQFATRNNMLIKVQFTFTKVYIWEHGRYLGPTENLIRSIKY
jgi:endonuclease/exonuclease/phosphatase family metal-dependent hydrolase